jgi:hypothetical protein
MCRTEVFGNSWERVADWDAFEAEKSGDHEQPSFAAAA